VSKTTCGILNENKNTGFQSDPPKDVGKMRNCGMRKVKCGIQNCGNGCGMVGKTRNAERVHGESKPAEQGWKTGLENGFKGGLNAFFFFLAL